MKFSNTNNPKFSYKTYAKAYVYDKNKPVKCDLYELWIHIDCKNFKYLDYRYLQNCNESWYCKTFCSIIFLFNSLSSDKTSEFVAPILTTVLYIK